jgi:isopenicillin N synthase-like dioxygenase
MVAAAGDGSEQTFEDFDARYTRDDYRFGVSRAGLSSLPMIDIGPFLSGSDEAARIAAAQQMRKAAIDIGFFYLTGHGFAPSEFDELLEFGRRFFALPAEAKAKIHWNNSPGNGYIPVGGINAGNTRDSNPDQKERLYFAREFALNEAEADKYPWQSQWPDEQLLPGFRRFLTSYKYKSVALAQAVGRAFAHSLNLPETYFADHMGRFGGSLVYNFYPRLNPATINQTQWNFSPHTDYGAFTILLQDGSGGLQVRNSNRQWIDVVPEPGTLIVNIGDMLAMITNDLYTSNLHRVANFSGKERISVSFFVSPPPATELSCLPTCQGPGNPPRYEPVNAGEYSRMLLEQYHRTGRPGLAPRTADRLAAR